MSVLYFMVTFQVVETFHLKKIQITNMILMVELRIISGDHPKCHGNPFSICLNISGPKWWTDGQTEQHFHPWSHTARKAKKLLHQQILKFSKLTVLCAVCGRELCCTDSIVS